MSEDDPSQQGDTGEKQYREESPTSDETHLSHKQNQPPKPSRLKPVLALAGIVIIGAGIWFVTQQNKPGPEPVESVAPAATNTPAPSNSPTFSLVKYVNDNGSNVKKEPTLKSQILTTLNLNTEVKDSGIRKNADNIDWANIQLADGRPGWISQKFLSEQKTKLALPPADQANAVEVDGFSIVPPVGWTKGEDLGKGAMGNKRIMRYFAEPDNTLKANFLVDIEGFAEPVDKICDIMKAGFAKQTDRQLVDSGITAIGGEPSCYISSKFSSHGYDIRTLQYYIPGPNKRQYSLIFTVLAEDYDSMEPAFKQAVASVRTNESSSTAAQANSPATDNQSTDESAVKARAQAWVLSWESRDLTRAEIIMHNNFTSESLNKWQWLKQRKEEAAKTQNRHIDWVGVQASVNGDKAEVTATQNYSDKFYNGQVYNSRKRITLRFVRWTDGEWYLTGLQYQPV